MGDTNTPFTDKDLLVSSKTHFHARWDFQTSLPASRATTRTSTRVPWGQKQQKSSTTEHQCPVFVPKANTEIYGQVFKRAQQPEGFVELLSVNTTVGTAGCSSGNLAQAGTAQKPGHEPLWKCCPIWSQEKKRETNSTESKGAATTDSSFLPVQTRFQTSSNPPKIKVPGHWKPKRQGKKKKWKFEFKLKT